jgi:hypothetical protein
MGSMLVIGQSQAKNAVPQQHDAGAASRKSGGEIHRLMVNEGKIGRVNVGRLDQLGVAPQVTTLSATIPLVRCVASDQRTVW